MLLASVSGMRGVDYQQSGMFSYLSPEARVRQDHPLRAIGAVVDEVLGELSSAICCNVFGDWPAVDSAGEVAAGFVGSDVVLDPQRTVVDGGDRLQRVVSLVCGDEPG